MAEISLERKPIVRKPQLLKPAFTAAGSLVIVGLSAFLLALPGMIHGRGRTAGEPTAPPNTADGNISNQKSASITPHSLPHKFKSESPEDYSDPTSREAQRIFLARQAEDRLNVDRENKRKRAEQLLALNMKELIGQKTDTPLPEPVHLQVASISAAMNDLRAIAASYGGAIQNVPAAESDLKAVHAIPNQPHVPTDSTATHPSERILVAMSIPSDRSEEALISISKMSSLTRKSRPSGTAGDPAPFKNSMMLEPRALTPNKLALSGRTAKDKLEVAAGSRLILLELRT